MRYQSWIVLCVLALSYSCADPSSQNHEDGGTGEDARSQGSDAESQGLDASHDARRDGDGDPGDADLGGSDATSDVAIPDAEAATDAGIVDCHETAGATPFVLDDGYCVVWRTPLAHASSAIGMMGPSTLLGLQFPDRTIVEIAVDPVAGEELSRDVALTFTPTLTEDRSFASQYVAVGPDGSVAVGYNLSASSSSFDGEMFLWPGGAAPIVTAPAQGNFDADWLEPGRILVNGLGLGASSDGQGLYLADLGPDGLSGARRLIDNLGLMSGQAKAGDILLAGGYGTWTGFTGSRIFAFTRAEISSTMSLGATLDAEEAGDVVFERPTTGMGTGQSIAIIGSTMYIVAADDRGLAEGIERIPMTTDSSDESVRAGTATMILSKPAGANDFVLDLSSHGRLLGIHALLEDGATMYLVIRQRA